MTLGILGGSAVAAYGWNNNPPVEGVVGQPFSYTFNVDNGCNISALNVVQGALPAGIVLNGNTLEGAPTATGGLIYTVTEGCHHGSETSSAFTLIVVANGVNGTNGTNGTNGSNGENGATGEIGPQGPAGSAGPSGANGSQGVQGPMGATGAQGAPGIAPVVSPAPTVGSAAPVYAQLTVLNIHKHANGRTINFQGDNLGAHPVLMVTWWEDVHGTYHETRIADAPIRMGVFVHDGYAIKVRLVHPTSNVLVKVG